MPKVFVNEFKFPLVLIDGKPFKYEEEDKLFWVEFSFKDEEFKLEGLSVLDNGRSLEVKKVRIQDERKLLQFKGIPEKALIPGTKLYPSDWPLVHDKKAYLVPLGPANKKPAPGKAILKSDLWDRDGIEIDFKAIAGPNDKFLLQVSSPRSVPWLMGLGAKLLTSDGKSLDLAILTPGMLESRDLSDLIAKTFRFPGNPTVNAIHSINLRMRGWIQLPPPLWSEEFEESHGKDGFRVMTKALDFYKKKVKNAAAQPGGIADAELRAKMKLPLAVFDFVLEKLQAEAGIRKKDDWWLPVGEPSGFLSPVAQNALKKLEEAGALGINTADEKVPILKASYENLARMDLAVQTEEGWIYSQNGYKAVLAKLCPAGSLQRQYKIAEVREILDCSRRQILGLLNRMEADGYVVWKEDVREVVKEYVAP